MGTAHVREKASVFFFLKMQETEISAPSRSSFPICGQQGGIEERRKKLIIC